MSEPMTDERLSDLERTARTALSCINSALLTEAVAELRRLRDPANVVVRRDVLEALIHGHLSCDPCDGDKRLPCFEGDRRKRWAPCKHWSVDCETKNLLRRALGLG